MSDDDGWRFGTNDDDRGGSDSDDDRVGSGSDDERSRGERDVPSDVDGERAGASTGRTSTSARDSDGIRTTGDGGEFGRTGNDDEFGTTSDADRDPWETADTPAGSGSFLRAGAEVVVVIVLAVVAAAILVLGGAFALFAAYGTTDVGTVPLLLVSLLGSQFAFAGVAYAYTRWRGDPLSAIGIRVPTLKEWGLVLAGTVGAFALAIAASIAVQTLGLQAAENSTATTAAEVPSSLLVLIPVAIFVIGPCEELLFRGGVQRRLRQAASAPVAIVVSGALFAGVHVIALAGSPSAMLTTVGVLFFPTLVFGVLYEYTGNVVVTALVHGLYDAVLFGLLYVSLTFAPESAQGGANAVLAIVAGLL